MGIPKPGDNATAKLIGITYLLLQRHLRWPTFAQLDSEFDQTQVTQLEAEDVLRAAPAGLFYGHSGGVAPSDDQRIGLTLAGLAACPDAEEDVSAFIATVRYAADLRDGTPLEEGDPTIAGDSIASAILLPAAGRADQIARLGEILAVEPWGWTNRTGHSDAWRFTIGRRVRRMRSVTDVANYWAQVREPRVIATVPVPDTPAPDPDQASRIRAWIELHAEPPRLVIVNASDAEIRNIVPTPALLSRDNTGDVSAYIGGNALGRVAELSPGGAVVVQLTHFARSARDPAVESVLHIEFDDTRGQRWQLGHGQIIPIESPHGHPMTLSAGHLVAASALDLSEPAAAFATATDARVAFLSYVHENEAEVDRLQAELETDDIVVWRDIDQLFPGDNIRTVITRAIRERSFAFISCFSAERAKRDRTVANSELAAAIGVLQEHTTSSWFIPVAFDDAPLPDVDLGPIHGHINDILRANLYGPRREAALVKLRAALHRLT